MRERRLPRAAWAVGLAAPLFLTALPVAAPPAAAVDPIANPPIEEACGIDLTLVLDASGSVSSAGAVDDVRTAAEALMESLAGTDSRARITQFATLTEQLAPSTLITTESLNTGGTIRTALNRYYNPQPPRPGTVTIRRYDGSGSPLTSGNYTTSNSSIMYTNWDASLAQAAETTEELVVYVTDGDPTAFNFDQPGDPFNPQDVAVGTDGSAQARTVTLDRAVEEANRIKASGTRMLAIGVGAALDNAASEQRLVQIAGPQIARDDDIGDIDSINELDVALVTDFEDLAELMRQITIQLCSPSLTIRKLAQEPDDATYAPAGGWDMTVTPEVPGGDGFRWILPDAAPAASKTVTTNADGFAQFQWEPDPPEEDSTALVAEDLQPGWIAGRPDDTDFRCELRNEDNQVRVVEGELDGDQSFLLDPVGQEIVTCSVYNSYDYQPDITIEKTNTPTEVRGDLDPPAELTSSYAVTNPGNASLSNVAVTDDRCGPVEPVPLAGPNVGDTSPANGLLDPGEIWRFTCTRPIQTTTRAQLGAVNIVNTAEVVGTDPAGTVVTDSDTDDVDVFTPAVSLTKLVDGQEQVTVPSGQQVTYTYAATNTGNTPLGSIDLVDDTAPCEDPTRGADTPPGNDDNVMDVGETWNWSCDLAAPTESVLNTAEVTGTPLNPAQGNVPFPNPNPVVRADDTAQVNVVSPGITLTKSVEPDFVVLSPQEPLPPEPVTYTFEATNGGDTPLNRPGAWGGGPSGTDAGWIVDARCLSPAVYVSGDTSANQLLDPGETWTFTCPGEVTQPTVNLATITGLPSAANGEPLPGLDPVSDLAVAFVQVARPGIDIVKTALRGVVLDPGADPISGPDTPEPRQAEYSYQVSNTGNIPLSLEGPGAQAPEDDICSPLVLADGDANGDGLLDPDEVWEYTCATTLDREDANTPPVTGAESGLVTNTVEVTGVPERDDTRYPDKVVSATDQAQVLVIEPGLEITKTATPDAVVAGGDITYRVQVANTGDVGLDLIGPEDSKCAPLVYDDGDANGNGILDGVDSGAAETWTFTCTRSVGLPAPPETVDENTATVQGVDPLGNVYADVDTAEVRVIDPAISLTKTVSDELVPAGTSVDYEFLVTNSGQSPVVADDVLADITLRDVSSPAIPACNEPVLIAKEGGNQDDFLDRDPPETWRYGCSGVIDERTVNAAVVRGVGGSTIGAEVPVFDFAGAFVDVFHPGISVEKSADPTQLLGSGEVTYTYRVTNTGDVPLSDVAARIVDDTCAPVEYVSGDEDGDGLLDTIDSIFEDALDETWLFTCTTTIDETTTNTVVVTGSPTDPSGEPLCESATPCDVSDEDQARVEVVEPGTVVITKRTTQSTNDRFGFTFDDEGFRLGDGDSSTFDGLAPGRFTVTETGADGWELEGLRCVDPSGGTRVDLGAGTARIDLAAGETVRCTFQNTPGDLGPSNLGPDGDGADGLPDTGASPWLARMLVLAALCLALGSALLFAARRREQPPS